MIHISSTSSTRARSPAGAWLSTCNLPALGSAPANLPQALDDKSKDRLGHERELFKYLDRLMTELRAKKRRNEDRLAADAAIPISAEDQARLSRRTFVKEAEHGDLHEDTPDTCVLTPRDEAEGLCS